MVGLRSYHGQLMKEAEPELMKFFNRNDHFMKIWAILQHPVQQKVIQKIYQELTHKHRKLI